MRAGMWPASCFLYWWGRNPLRDSLKGCSVFSTSSMLGLWIRFLLLSILESSFVLKGIPKHRLCFVGKELPSFRRQQQVPWLLAPTVPSCSIRVPCCPWADGQFPKQEDLRIWDPNAGLLTAHWHPCLRKGQDRRNLVCKGHGIQKESPVQVVLHPARGEQFPGGAECSQGDQEKVVCMGGSSSPSATVIPWGTFERNLIIAAFMANPEGQCSASVSSLAPSPVLGRVSLIHSGLCPLPGVLSFLSHLCLFTMALHHLIPWCCIGYSSELSPTFNTTALNIRLSLTLGYLKFINIFSPLPSPSLSKRQSQWCLHPAFCQCSYC